MKISIFHNKTIINDTNTLRMSHDGCSGPFFSFCGSCTLRLAYTYHDEDTDLSRIWRRNNRVDGSPFEVVPDDCRSLSVGDVIGIETNGSVAFHAVSAFGFESVPASDVAAALTTEIPDGYQAI